MKEISLNATVYETVSQNPEVRDIIVGLGFAPLRDDKMLQTAGRMMTLGKAAKQFGISYETIVATMEENGFKVKEDSL